MNDTAQANVEDSHAPSATAHDKALTDRRIEAIGIAQEIARGLDARVGCDLAPLRGLIEIVLTLRDERR